MAAFSLWLLAGCVSALAFPPAPYHLIYGFVRDQYGTPIMNNRAKVILQTPSGTTLTAPILPGLAVGVNYEIRVPIDAGLIPGKYKTTALKVAAPFSMLVVIGGITNVPIQPAAISATLGEPTQMTRMDLTLGVDSNGDGIPDAWENAFLAAIGSSLTLADLNAGLDLVNDGRTLAQEFLLGTYPFDPGNAFAVRMVSLNGDETVLEFRTMKGRSYSVLGSPDLEHWTLLQFRLAADGPGSVIRTSYTASAIQTLRVQVPQTPSAPNAQFFRVQLQ